MNKVVPVKEAMLLCDSIITEIGTNKKSLIGIFENISAIKFPCLHFRLGVYIKFTNAEGKYNFKLELLDLEKNQIIGQGNIPELGIPDRLGSYELVFNLEGLAFNHPGKYDFRVSYDGVIFANKTFNVIELKRS